MPAFSPDGNAIAFGWGGEKDDNQDIYVKLIGAGTPLRLTTNTDADSSPACSPDGRFIAFFRQSATGGAYYLVPFLWMLFTRVDQVDSEIMLVEDFR
jgi:Tol biopolymer transport system component